MNVRSDAVRVGVRTHAVLCLVIVAASGCGPQPATPRQTDGAAVGTAAASPVAGGSPAASPGASAVFGVTALATLTSVRDERDHVRRCATQARESLLALARTYPLEPLVRTAARKIMPECLDHASLAALLEVVPASGRARDEELDLIRLYLRYLNRFADAERLVKPLVDIDPNNTDTLSLYAAALHYQGRFDEAVALVDRRWTVLVRERNTDIMTMRADQFLKDGRPDRAASVLNQVLELDPVHMFALSTMRAVRAAQGDTEGAAAAAATAQVIEQSKSEQANVAAKVAERFQDFVLAFDALKYDEAEAILQELIATTSNDTMLADLYASLAVVYQQQGRLDDATKARDESTRHEKLAAATLTPTGR